MRLLQILFYFWINILQSRAETKDIIGYDGLICDEQNCFKFKPSVTTSEICVLVSSKFERWILIGSEIHAQFL